MDCIVYGLYMGYLWISVPWMWIEVSMDLRTSQYNVHFEYYMEARKGLCTWKMAFMHDKCTTYTMNYTSQNQNNI